MLHPGPDQKEAVNIRMPRRLYRKMEQLEARLAPAGEPRVIEVQFVSADGSVVATFPVQVHTEQPVPREEAIRRFATDNTR